MFPPLPSRRCRRHLGYLPLNVRSDSALTHPEPLTRALLTGIER